MPRFNWGSFLKRWSRAMVASGEFSSVLSPDAARTKWAGFAPASDPAIEQAEARLGLRLPESYRQFLKISNGWWLLGTAGPLRIWPVEEIRPMAEVEPETVKIWSELPHDSEADPGVADLPNSHLGSAIQISEDNDGRYLLNPLIKPHTDEWQAAFFAPWVPGAECYPSFQDLMSSLGEAFMAAHPTTGSGARTRERNLAKPPADAIDDPRQFTDELQRLGYFRFVSADTTARMIREFLTVYESFRRNNMQLLAGPFPSPGAVILCEESGRVVNLDESRLAEERGGYAIAKTRSLLALAGIELGDPLETTTADSYSVRLEGVTHDYFRLRKGRPALPGGEHQSNVARYVMYGTVKLLNKVLKERACVERIASLEELRADFSEEMRLALVLLDDDLCYLLMWSPVIHNYCRPMRPDVFR
jgi:hypothetical protein